MERQKTRNIKEKLDMQQQTIINFKIQENKARFKSPHPLNDIRNGTSKQSEGVIR